MAEPLTIEEREYWTKRLLESSVGRHEHALERYEATVQQAEAERDQARAVLRDLHASECWTQKSRVSLRRGEPCRGDGCRLAAALGGPCAHEMVTAVALVEGQHGSYYPVHEDDSGLLTEGVFCRWCGTVAAIQAQEGTHDS